MLLLFISFLAGVLTVLAPCVLPVLPVIIGGAVQGAQKRNPYVITGSLAIAIVLFTLLLKFSTAFINVPQAVWTSISGGILIIFGLISVFPRAWDAMSVKLGLSNRSEQLLADSRKRNSLIGDVLIGLSLGPVFSSCSPTYFLILATVLPRSFAAGVTYLIAYALGLSLVLLLISVLGQKFIRKARFAANPNGWFKRGLGVLFILVGIFIISGADKYVQTSLLASGFNITNIEQSILESTQSQTGITPTALPAGTTNGTTAGKNYPMYREIVNPSGFVNASSVTIGELVGKKVILIDFMTYSCINCIRTFPYLNAWYDKYQSQGLEIIGIHTPEFAFEKNIDNVRAAMKRYGIRFPIVLDNDYGTWGAYQNSYWPRKYLIDLDGHIVYDHIGEGGYDETEAKIQELLHDKLVHDHAATTNVATSTVTLSNMPISFGTSGRNLSPETYFGSDRNEYLANGLAGRSGAQTLRAPQTPDRDKLYLSGLWNFVPEHASNQKAGAGILYKYNAQSIFFVASANNAVKVTVLRDGKPLSHDIAGSDIEFAGAQSYVTIQDERLYNLIQDPGGAGEHTLELQIQSPGINAYTFTFG